MLDIAELLYTQPWQRFGSILESLQIKDLGSVGAVESDISAFEIVVACGAILSPYRRNAESSEDTPCATPGTSTSFGCNDYESRVHSV